MVCSLTCRLTLWLAHEVGLDLPCLLFAVRLDNVVDHLCVDAFRVDEQAVHVKQNSLDVGDGLFCFRHDCILVYSIYRMIRLCCVSTVTVMM